MLTQRASFIGFAGLACVVASLAIVGLRHSDRSVLDQLEGRYSKLSQLPADYFVTHSGDDEGGYFLAHPAQYGHNGIFFAKQSQRMQLNFKAKHDASKLSQLPSDYFVSHPGDDEGDYFLAHPTQYDQNGKPFARGVRKVQLRSIGKTLLDQVCTMIECTEHPAMLLVLAQ